MNPKKHLAAIAALATAGTLALSGCGNAGSSSTSGGAASGADGAKVTLLTVSQSCDYCAIHTESFKKAAEAAGIEVTVVTTEFDAAEQAQQINQAVSTQPDAVVVWPADATAIQPSLARLKQSGIPTVVTNSRPTTDEQDLWTAYTGPNDIENGRAAAEAMVAGFEARGFGDSGTVVVVTGQPGTPPAIDRLQGFTDYLSENAPGITVAGEQPGNWDQTTATSAASTLFTQFPDAQGVYAEADNMLAGAITAAGRANLDPASLVMVGSNCSIEGYDAIEGGSQYASVLQSPIDDGELAAEILIKVLDGDSVDYDNYLTPKVITSDNLSDCAAAVGK
jgi:ribose transport system substrate-binding protein